MQLAFAAGKHLQRFGRFQRSNQIHDRSQNANGIAGFFQTRRPASFDQASQTSRLVWPNRKRNAVTGNRRGINPGNARLNRKIIHQKTRFKIIRAIQDQRKPGQQFLRVPGIQICHDSLNLDLRIQRAKLAFRRNRFRQRFPCIAFIEKYLPLQVRRLHKIPIQYPNPAHACPHQQIRNRRADGATAHNHCA